MHHLCPWAQNKTAVLPGDPSSSSVFILAVVLGGPLLQSSRFPGAHALTHPLPQTQVCGISAGLTPSLDALPPLVLPSIPWASELEIPNITLHLCLRLPMAAQCSYNKICFAASHSPDLCLHHTPCHLLSFFLSLKHLL